MTTPDPNLPFRTNVRLLGDLLGKTLKVQVGEGLFEQIEMIRKLSKDACSNDEDAKRSLNTILQSLTQDQMLIVAKAFGHFLNLANIAENVHRIHRSRWHALNAPTVPSPGSIEALLVICKKNNVTKATFDSALEKLNIDLVLTAHPTEVMRRTMMQKYESIAKLLEVIDEKSLTQVETEEVHESIYRETTAIWQTDEIRRHKPSPLDEAKWGFAIIESSLWQVVPQYLRNLNQQLLKHHLTQIPLAKSSIQFSSWMGGDRDGNPNVTSEVTNQICLMARWMAADLYARDIHKLSASLSMQNANQALSQIVGQTNEPYRALLRTLRNKCFATCQWIENSLKGINGSDDNIIKSKQDLLGPLLLCYQSLVDCKAECIAQGELTDLIKRVACFGVSLTRLDIRQEAAKHSALLSEITESMGLGSYHDWDEAQRFSFLNDKLTHPEKLIKDDLVLSPMSQEVWNTFLMIAKQLEESLGAYVISMCKSPSDILAVCLLQREAKVSNFLRVVPLFETLSDLNNAANCFEGTLKSKWYKNHIRGKQEIMIGYSDSGKDAGILAAGWAQYRAQEGLVETAKTHEIELTLFHGRGGSVGRGGAPAHIAILSQGPGTVQGRLRLTEQGEVIRNKYGLPKRAYRTLELYVSATLQATILPSPNPQPAWRKMMDELAEDAFKAYRSTVKDDQDFPNYFTKVTPLKEIGTLMIGSRPTRRQTISGIEGLRAIPWVFAWTQNRLILPAWLGVGEALTEALKEDKALIFDMVAQWPFFRALLSMIEMVLAKADPFVFTFYEQRLLQNDEPKLGIQLKEKLDLTINAVKNALQIHALLESNPILLRTISLRSPYLYPLHVLQAELCRRLRNADEMHHEVESDALMITISGIAAGMQNTG